MNKVLNIAIGLVAAIIGGVIVLQFAPQPQPAQPAPDQYGAVNGSNFETGDLTVGGVPTFAKRLLMAGTSSVPCSMQNPFGATSTLTRFTALVTSNGIGAAQTVDLATSTTAFGTTSPSLVWAHTVSAGRDGMLWTPGAASSTVNANVLGGGNDGTDNLIIGPTQYVNLRIATGTPGAAYWTGACEYHWQKM